LPGSTADLGTSRRVAAKSDLPRFPRATSTRMATGQRPAPRGGCAQSSGVVIWPQRGGWVEAELAGYTADFGDSGPFLESPVVGGGLRSAPGGSLRN
jgi:hypothetical protein